MADPTITGSFGSESFQFTLNGVSTQKQMERLIQLTEAMAKRIKADLDTGSKRNKAEKEHLDNQEKLVDQQKTQIKKNKEFNEGWEDLIKVSGTLKYGFKDAAKEMGGWVSATVGATSFLVGSLMGYADNIAGALKMGVSGEVMDFAIAAKTAGVSMSTLTKALSDTGGGFASLGNGATDGAKNFASLVSSVRSATQSVGNLGMTNDEMAMFTAQQTKLAVSQGFKGKAAQDVVIRNSRELGKELDDLANRTGKNVLEMAAAAAKLASDPIVTTFVKSAQAGGAAVSKAVQSFGASLNAQFGEMGGQIGSDVLKSALGGLPFAITQTGKNMLIASQTTYNELERQAQKAKRGEEITAEDRKKLNDTVLQEVAARGDQLRMMANLEGPAGDSARQILAMAKEAEFYNSAEGRKRREQDKSAQEFNMAIREFQANLQALAIPFLKLINGVSWVAFIDILNGFTLALGLVLKPLGWLGSIIGDSGAGTVVGVLLGLMGVVGFATAGFSLLKTTLTSVVGSLTKFGVALKTFQKGPIDDFVGPKLPFVGPTLPRSQGGTEDGTSRTPLYKAGRQAGEFVNKFSTELKFATAAVIGLGIASIGKSMLEEDAESSLGKFLVFVGTGAEILGVWVPIITGLSALFPALATSLSGLVLAVGMQTNMMLASVKDFAAKATATMTGWATTAWASISKFAATTTATMTGWATTAWASISKFAATTTATMAGWASTALASVTSFALQAASTMAGWASTALASVTSFALRMASSTMSLLVPLKGLAIAAFAAAAPFLPLIAAVTAIAGVGYLIYDNWSAIVDAGKALYDWIANAATKLWDFITSPFKMLSDWLKGSWLGKMFGGSDKTPNTEKVASTGDLAKAELQKEYMNLTDSNGMTNVDKEWYKANGKSYPTDQNNSGYSKELSSTQSSAIDQNRVKDAESTVLQKKQIALLEEISGTGNAQLGVQARSASAQDNGNRYLKTLSMSGTG